MILWYNLLNKRREICLSTLIEYKVKNLLQNNGHIEAVFDVYGDFSYYENGVYYRTSNTLLRVHKMEVLGWRTENEVNYWLCKNSWEDD